MYPFHDENLDASTRAKDLITRLRLDEKFTLLAGVGLWWTRKIKRLNLPRMGMSDGPNGVSFHSSFLKNTQFPVTKCIAATWDTKLAERAGVAMAEEIRAAKKHILLAPGINIDRTPLNGRTFEYFSEDPFLTKELTKPFVKGVQSQQIAACVKHFAANNQEFRRHTIDVLIDKRTLHEIYLRAFEDSVKEADPWAIMACYNKVNGFHGCENEYLLQKVLVEKWGFSGFVMSDWWATRYTSTTGCIKAGLSLEMPKPIVYKNKKLKEAYKAGNVSEERINELLIRMLTIMFKTKVMGRHPPKGSRNSRSHYDLAQQIAEEGIVLLKNTGILPLIPNKPVKIAIKGRNAKKKMGKFEYGGSSAVVPPFEITPFKGLKKLSFIKIVREPENADYVIVFTGLNHNAHEDTENTDRFQLELPEEEEQLINEMKQRNPNTIVVLINGSPIAMNNWMEGVPAIIEAWFPGMMGGNAIANVLFGFVNPSGKLPISYPKSLEDSPAHSNPDTYPGFLQVKYNEELYVGYRHYDKNDIDPLFPFGFGLSYTTFELTTCDIDKETVSSNGIIIVKVGIRNMGNMGGAEVVQVYVSAMQSSVERPVKELCGFGKIFLHEDEKKVLEIPVNIKNFAFYDINTDDWKVEKGQYKLAIGTSSRNIIFEKTIWVT